MNVKRSLAVILAVALVLAQIPLTVAAAVPAVTHNLVAGQHHVAGTVSAWHGDDTLYVLFDTNDDWQLEETHAWITATQPAGNQSPGSSKQDSGEYEPPVDSDTLELPLGSFGPGDCFYVLAHASVVQVPGRPVEDADQQETAWGGNLQGQGGQWFFYFRYCIPEVTIILGTITVTKLDQSESELAGAEFTLFKLVDSTRQQVGTPQVTGEDGTVVFEDLEAGTYVVVETGVPFGYKADDSDYESDPITLTLDGSTVSSDSVTFVNTLVADGQITVYKEDDEGEILDGAEFTLYRLEDDTWVSVAGPQGTSDGQTVFADLLPGTYRVTETTTPSGYEPAGGPQDTTLVYDPQTQTVSTDELTFVNNKIQAGLGSITVRKWVTAGVELFGATFALYQGDDKLSEVTLTGTHEHTWPNLAAGTYRVVEVSAPSGFAKSAPSEKNVTLTQGDETVSSATVDFYNSRLTEDLPASITVIKWNGEPEYDQYCIVSDEQTEIADGRNAALATGPTATWNAPTDIANMVASGAKWIWESPLVSSPIDGDVVEFWRSFSVGGTPVSGTLKITADNGYEVYLNGTLVGNAQVYGDWQTYRTEAYVTTSGWQSVETYDVSGLLKSGLNTLYIKAANEYMGPIDGQASGTTTSNPGGLIFRLCLNVANGTLLDGAAFTLSQDGTTVRGPSQTSGGSVTWNNVNPGTYTITETTVPSGFTGGDPQDVTVAAGQHIVVEFINSRQAEPVYGSITVNKLDATSSEPLGGATFEVRSEGEPVRTHTMTSGTYTFTGLDLGTYTVVETTAPSGYLLSTSPSQEVTLTEANPDQEVTFRNERRTDGPTGSILITVVKTDGGNVGGLTVSIGGSLVGQLTTDSSGQVSVSGLAAGSYTANAGDTGYTGDGPKTIVLPTNSSSGQATITLTPVPPVVPVLGAVEGTVTEQGTGRVLPGAEVRLFDSEGRPWGSPGIADGDGYYLITNVPAGTYSVSAFLAGYSPDFADPVVVVSGETTRADLVLAKDQVVIVPPQPPANPPELPKTGAEYLDPTIVGLALLALGAIVKRRRHTAKH